jgi:hypothetical protein
MNQPDRRAKIELDRATGLRESVLKRAMIPPRATATRERPTLWISSSHGISR